MFAWAKCKKTVENKGTEEPPQMKEILDAWIESTKVTLTIFGKTNVDQTIFLNAVLEETTKQPPSGNPDIQETLVCFDFFFLSHTFSFSIFFAVARNREAN